MYFRRCEVGVGDFRLVDLFRKIVGAPGSLEAQRPAGGSNVSVAVSPLIPRGAAVGDAMGDAGLGCMSTTRDLVRLAVCVSCSGVDHASAAAAVSMILLLLALEAERVLYF